MGASFESFLDVIAECYGLALIAWRNDHAPAVRIEDLYANHLRRVRIVTDRLPEGVMQVTIIVQPRNVYEKEMYYWRARKLAGQYYLYYH